MKKLTYTSAAFVILTFNCAAQSVLPTPDHIVVVIEENRAYSQIIGDTANASYINQLATGGALFTQSFGLTHPSQPNYLMMYSGDNQGISTLIIGDYYPTDFPWFQTLPYTTPNLGACLFSEGYSFGGYAEDLPSAGFTGATNVSGTYASKHAVYVYWQGTGTNSIPASANQPFSSFPNDYNNLPTVSYVIPNLDNDMHNDLFASGINTADNWLETNIDAYVQWANTHNSLLIVTFDEDDDFHGNQITTIFYGPMVIPGQYSETINHYNILRTIEDMYGLCHSANDSTATPITDCWVNTSAIQNILPPKKIDLYPNPTEGLFNIECMEEYDYLIVTNMFGQQVMQRNIYTPILQLDASYWAKGMYLVSAYKGIQRVFSKKLVVQ